MRATLPLSALSLAVAATLVVASPAAAAPFTDGDVEVGGTTWGVSYFQTGLNPRVQIAERADWDGGIETFDEGIQPVYIEPGAFGLYDTTRSDCADDGDLVAAADATGDQIATCELRPLDSGNGTLNASYELRFFADGATVRARLIVTNESGSVVSGAHVGFGDNYYQDGDTRLGASTTQGNPAATDSTVVDGDKLWVIYDAVDIGEGNFYEVPVVLTAAGSSGAAVLPLMGDAAGDGNDVQETLYPLPALAPGQSVELVQFYVWNFFDFDQPIGVEAPVEPATVEVVTEEGFTKTALLEPAALFLPSALAAVEESWDARSRFDTLSARDAAGIADPSQVLNWNPVAEELAETGPSDSLLPLAAFAGLLLLAGAGVIAVRRRPVNER